MARRRRRFGSGLAALGGARADVLAVAPGARPRFVAMGGVLLSTGGLAVLSAAFAVHMALGVWWPLALVAGLGWGFVVVNLDRMLVVGMAHDASLKRNLVLAVPRVGLALVLGVVIATPLTLQIFAKEIDTEIGTRWRLARPRSTRRSPSRVSWRPRRSASSTGPAAPGTPGPGRRTSRRGRP